MALRFRTGVNTGLVLVGEGENLAIGDAVNVAARLEQAAAPGEILLGAETLRLVRDAVEVEPLEPLSLKGKSEPVRGVPAAGDRSARAGPRAPLRRAAGGARARAASAARGVGARGRRSPAVICSRCWARPAWASRGWSRSCLPTSATRRACLRGRCLHYGEGITFWPLIEALTPVGEPAQPVLERLGSGGAATPEELFWEVRRLLESLAAERPVILHVDDLQWAEPMLLDLLDHVVELSRGAPILVLCTARPELLEDRPAWGGGKLNATTVLLEPLGDRGVRGAARSARRRARPGRARAGRRRERGQPAVPRGDGGARARDAARSAVPPTIQALLAARLERLAAEEREVLERGAIEGEVFHRSAVRALAGERARGRGRPAARGARAQGADPPAPARRSEAMRRSASATC